MSTIVLIQAGPTPWDVEGRIVGDHPLPLTELACATIESLSRNLPGKISSILYARNNESTEQAAKIVHAASKGKLTDSPSLEEMNLGLWQGLTRSELRFRHPKVFPLWEENPLSVNPPDGETLAAAIERIDGALRKLLRRRKGTVVLVLRPFVMQIALGLLKQEDPQAIARHLQKTSPMETIESVHGGPS